MGIVYFDSLISGINKNKMFLNIETVTRVDKVCSSFCHVSNGKSMELMNGETTRTYCFKTLKHIFETM